MRNSERQTPVVFIVGSPRSGTTILGEVLGRHPDIINWYEPYFVWDWHVGNLDTDVRTEGQATDATRRFIRREFDLFLRKAGKKMIVEKTPENSFKIPFLHAVFPNAKWIHIVRDGRDVTLSISKEWEKRRQIVEQRNVGRFVTLAKTMLGRQPFWRNRLQALLFELRNMRSLDPRTYMNKSKWEGRVGWGPRFPGWQDAFKTHTLLQFNALQWANSVESIKRYSYVIPSENWIEIRYEQLVNEPEGNLRKVLEYLHLEMPEKPDLWNDLRPSSVGGWKKAFPAEQIGLIEAVAGQTLLTAGYQLTSL